jgi:hypothetical protein
MGIDQEDAGKTAPEADRCAPFLSMRMVSTVHVAIAWISRSFDE